MEQEYAKFPGALNVREMLVERPPEMLLGAPEAAANVTVCSSAR